MRRRLTLLLVLSTIFLLVSSSAIIGADKPGSKQKKSGLRSIYDPPDRVAPEHFGAVPTSLSQGVFYPFAGKILSPGDTVGYTYYDYQKNGSMGRQIAVDGDGGRHFNWMNLVGPDIMSYYRYVDYNYQDSSGYWVGAMHVSPSEPWAGYTNIELLSDNREVLGYHHINPSPPDSSPTRCMLAIEDSTPGIGSFNTFDIPDSLPGTEYNTLWPYVAVDDSDRVHIISLEGVTGTAIRLFGYTRCYRDYDSLKCEAPGVAEVNIPPDATQPSSNMIAAVDSSSTLSHIIVSSPVSNKVAIIYTKHRNPAPPEIDCDVYYIESTNGGQDWIDAGGFSGITKNNITNYTSSDFERAYHDVSAIYDYDDSLHISWNAHWFNELTGQYSTRYTSLYHWSSQAGIRKIAFGYWPETNPGILNRNLGKMSISAKQSNGNLYVIWTQFDPDDFSAGGFSNGEIYASASTDGGNSWDVPINLTDTQTPDCSPGDCESDHWSTLAEEIDDSLHIFYVNDRDAGGIVQNEGSYTQNPMLYMKHPAWTPLSHPRVTADHHIYEEINVSNNSFKDTSFQVENLGTAQLDVTVSSSAPWIDITSDTSFSISSGGNPVDVSIRFNASSYSEVVLHDSIIVTSNDSAGNDRIVIPVRGIVVTDEDYYHRELAYVANWAMGILESNLGTFGEADPNGGMYTFEDERNYLYDGSVFLATINSDGDTLVSRDIFNSQFTHAASNLVVDTLDQGDHVVLRSRAKFYPFFPDIGTLWPGWWWGVEMSMENLMFEGENPPVPENVMISTIDLYPKSPPAWWPSDTPPTLGDLYLGMGLDWDVPTEVMVNNLGGYDDSYYLLGQSGTGAMTDYVAGLGFLDNSAPYGANIIDMPTYVSPNLSFLEGELYQIASTPGDSVYDQNVDLASVMTGTHIAELTDTVRLKFALAVTPDGFEDLMNAINKARVYSGYLSGALAGDVNYDIEVSVLDIAYLFYYLFQQGPAPVLWGSGDVDSAAGVNIGDVVYLADYIFLAGPHLLQRPPFPEVPPETLTTDTLKVVLDSNPETGKYIYNLELTNSDTTWGLAIPLSFGIAGGTITCDSVSFVSTRVQDFELKNGQVDTSGQRLLIGLDKMPGVSQVYSLFPGSGTIAKLYFTISDPSYDWSFSFNTTFYEPSNNLLFVQGSLPRDLVVPQFEAPNFMQPPTPVFVGDPLIGEKDLEVTFTDSSEGIVDSWYWSFGDGYTSTQQNPVHTYKQAGTYNVKLIVTNQFGSDSLIRENYIQVLDKPLAEFTADQTVGSPTLGVQFTDNSIGNITSWKWYFGDDDSSSEQDPYHEYTALGTYDVTLIATSVNGLDSLTKKNFIYTYPALSGDTVQVLNMTAAPNQEDVTVRIIMSNYSDSLAGITVPLIFDNPSSIQVDSVSFNWSRTAHFSDKGYSLEAETLFVWALTWMEPYLPTGQGLFATIYLKVEDVFPPVTVIFDSTSIEPDNKVLYATWDAGTITPGFYAGSLFVDKADTIPPEQPQNLVASALESGVSLTWDPVTDPDLRLYAVYKDYNRDSLDDTLATTNDPFYLDLTVSPGETLFYSVSAVDSSWNESEYSDYAHVIFGDTSAPVITLGPTVIAITDTMATIYWETDEEADGYVEIWVDTSWVPADSQTQFLLDHTITLTGLLPSTAYEYRVHSTDSLDNGPTYSESDTFTTATGPDVTPPQIIFGPAAVYMTDNSATIEWTTDEIANSKVCYGQETVYSDSAVDPGFVATHSTTLTGLLPATQYFYMVSSEDPSGNGPTYSGAFYGAGDRPFSVFCADLDGDTDLDLAVANRKSGNVSILKNNGDGTFQTKVDYVAGYRPVSVFCADLDGDLDLDLAVANFAADNVSILRNNGDGTFQTKVDYGVGDDPFSVFCADLDGDIDLDLAVANRGSDSVSILKNNGDGTFQTKVDYGTGNPAFSVFCADLDGDSDFDLAVPNYGGDNVSILKNNGDGTFQTKVNFGAGDGPNWLFCADLDGDLDLDLAVANFDGDNVSILKNNGDGTFQTKVDYGTGSWPYSVFCADLDGDSDLDLAVANFGSDNVSILKNSGDGTFQTKVDYGAGDGPTSVFCGDLDGDLDLDLAVANASSDNVSILKNSGDGIFTAPDSFTTDAAPDITPPAIVEGPIHSGISQNKAVIDWVTDEIATSTVQYGPSELYGSERTKSASVQNHQIVLTSLQDSTLYHYRVGSVDPESNGPTWSADFYFWTHAGPHADPPIILTGPYSSWLNDTQAQIDWTTDEVSDSWVYYRLEGSEEYDEAGSPRYVKEHSVVLTNLVPDTTYDFYVSSTDPQGNTVESEHTGGGLQALDTGHDQFTTKASPDVTAPVIISGPYVRYKTHDMAVVEWVTDETGNSMVEYGEDEYYGTDITYPEATINHTAFLSNLNSNTTYHFRVGSKDIANNGPTYSSDMTFTTSADVSDTEPPVITVEPGIAYADESRAIITWETDEPADSYMGYELIDGRAEAVVGESFCMLSHRTTLNMQSSYNVRVFSSDQYGNGPTYSDYFTVTALATPDVSAPAIVSGPEVVYVSENSAKISWETDELSSSFVEYGLSVQYTDVEANPENDSLHQVILTNLASSTTYHYRIKSADLFGNTYLGSDETFGTASSSDVTPPSTPTGLSTSYGNGWIKPGWNKNLEADLSGYNLHRGTVLSDTTLPLIASNLPDTAYRDQGLTNGVTYYYQVAAADRNSNESPPSEIVCSKPLSYVVGDFNGDEEIGLVDVVSIINYVFKGAEGHEPLEAGNVNCNEGITITDIVYLINYLFKGGEEPCICTMPLLLARHQTKAKAVLGLNFPTGDELEIIEVLLEAGLEEEVAGLELDLSFDHSKLEVDAINTTSRTDKLGLFYSIRSGSLKIGMVDIYGANTLSPGQGPILEIKLRQTERVSAISSFKIDKAIVANTSAQELEVQIQPNKVLRSIPGNFSLAQNYPNPFNARTIISYSLPEDSKVEIRIYNILGQRVTTLMNEYQLAGYKSVIWDGTNQKGKTVASGIYFYSIKAGDFTSSKKMLLLK